MDISWYSLSSDKWEIISQYLVFKLVFVFMLKYLNGNLKD